MEPLAFTQFLHEQIPLTKAMQIDTKFLSEEKIILSVPLSCNYNDKKTAFAGSIASLLTVCGWSMMYHNFHNLFPKSNIVVQKSEIQYITPIHHDFMAVCVCGDIGRKKLLIADVETKGKGKLPLHIDCICKEQVVATLDAIYYVVQS